MQALSSFSAFQALVEARRALLFAARWDLSLGLWVCWAKPKPVLALLPTFIKKWSKYESLDACHGLLSTSLRARLLQERNWEKKTNSGEYWTIKAASEDINLFAQGRRSTFVVDVGDDVSTETSLILIRRIFFIRGPGDGGCRTAARWLTHDSKCSRIRRFESQLHLIFLNFLILFVWLAPGISLERYRSYKSSRTCFERTMSRGQSIDPKICRATMYLSWTG